MSIRTNALSVLVLLLAGLFSFDVQAAESLKVHGIFSSNMVLQRDKPIKVWGWAPEGTPVRVVATFADKPAVTKAAGEGGRWEVTFSSQEANTKPQTITIIAGDEKVVLENLLIGDIWVMNGQSNMAWSLEKTLNQDIESAQANMPLLRATRISTNEQSTLQKDIPADRLAYGGWVVSTPETAKQFSAIGYSFASRVQRATGVPIGIIDNARGGASIESLVPYRKLREDPLTKRYVEWVDARAAAFDKEEWLAQQVIKWDKKVESERKKGTPDNKLPKKPTLANLRSWNVPGMSPSDAGSCYNGMFGAFIGLNIKGVLFHQGYNNAIGSACRPKRYRALMRLMVEGWREDFKDDTLPVGIIGFCAGGIPQTEENFELWSHASGAYIREAQRLGLADVGDTESTAFLPAFDVQIPGLHPFKKQEHGVRAARWAMSRVYDMDVNWDTASLVSAKPSGDTMVLTFDKPVMPDDMSTIPRGFSVAGEDGKFYRAHARFQIKKDQGLWSTANKSYETTVVHVWSPLVADPVAVRYGWASSAMGNLKVNGKAWNPLASFRTDDWDWPESEDPEETLYSRGDGNTAKADAASRNESRRQREAEMAVQILERLKTLGREPSQ